MKLSEQIKPISYLKANTAEVIRKLDEQGDPLIITVNGEAKAVLQGIKEYEKMQETLAFLKILALGRKDYEEGKFDSVENVFSRIDQLKA